MLMNTIMNKKLIKALVLNEFTHIILAMKK
jgi:hypothetical protein